MKQNITLAIDKRLLKRIRALAAERGISVSELFAEELQRIVGRERSYEKAKRRARARLRSPFHLGGEGIKDRDALHDRKNLR
jgi:hypothetical protein